MKLLIVALVLGAFGPAFAWGECAWVLWERYEFVNVNPGKPIERGDWQIFAALPTYDACSNTARQRAERKAETSPEAVNVKDQRVYELIGGGFGVRTEFKKPQQSSSYVELRCFPDTVKP